MNFYSLDGSKTDNNLFKDTQIYEKFDNLSPQNNQNEPFAGVPTTKSNATDSNYQCSDNYSVSGTTFGSVINGTTLESCKSECLNSNTNCIGFNFNTSNNSCTLKQNATSLMNSTPSNTLCIKKSAGNKNCKVGKKNSNESAFGELNAIFANTPEHYNSKMESNMESNMKSNSNKQLEEMIKNYYNMPSSEQKSLLSNLSRVTNIAPETINQNIPKLIEFINTEDTPNYNLIASVKQLGLSQQKSNPEQKILTTPSQLPIPSESEMSLTKLVTGFSKLNSQEQTQLVNTLSNYSGVTPEYIMKDLNMISNAINTGQISNAGIYNKIQTLSESHNQLNQYYPMNIPKIEKSETNLKNKLHMESEMESGMIHEENNVNNGHDGIFVDLDCFMSNIDVLKNHSDNMMIDLSLLLSNIKSCSYVKKSKKSNKTNDYSDQTPEQIVNKITSGIQIPSPNTVKLQSMKSNISVEGTETKSQGQVLGIIKEPFESTESHNKKNDWDYYDFVKVMILVVILLLLIFRNKFY